MNNLQHELNKLVNNSLYDVQRRVSKDLIVNVMMQINDMVVNLIKFTVIKEVDELEERHVV